MSGRIKVLDATGGPLIAANSPEIPYEYDEPGEFDRACNTFGLDAWQLPNELCPDRYVCGADDAPTDSHAQFAECIDAMNCNMMAGMTTNIGMNEIALFNYHMIPHHENGTYGSPHLWISLPQTCMRAFQRSTWPKRSSPRCHAMT